MEVQEEDWHVPVGAQVVGSNKAIRRYARRIVGWKEECHKENPENVKSPSGGVNAAPIPDEKKETVKDGQKELKEKVKRAPKIRREAEDSERNARRIEKENTPNQGAKRMPIRKNGNLHRDSDETDAGEGTLESMEDDPRVHVRRQLNERGFGDMDMKDPREPLDSVHPVDPEAVPREAKDEDYDEPRRPEPATGCRMVALYKSVPVYGTKYEFLVWRWVSQPELIIDGDHGSKREWPAFVEDEHNKVVSKEEKLYVELTGRFKTHKYEVGPELFDYATQHISEECKVLWSVMKLFSVTCPPRENEGVQTSEGEAAPKTVKGE